MTYLYIHVIKDKKIPLMLMLTYFSLSLSHSPKTFLLPMLFLCSNKVGRAVGGEAGGELLGDVTGDKTSRFGVNFRDL